MNALVGVAVVYLGLVALVAAASAVGAPLGTAARTGDVVGRVLVAVVVVADLVGVVRGHHPPDPAVHYAYAGCAVAIPFLMSGRRADPSLWVVTLIAVANLVVVLRLAATY